MELTQLRYFIRLAEVLNFTEASKQLFITQSTLSQSIRQTESELGTPLFELYREESIFDGCRAGILTLCSAVDYRNGNGYSEASGYAANL